MENENESTILEELLSPNDESLGPVAKLEGIYCKGYGSLPKIVMFDPDLTIGAKALYALFCTYGGGGEDCPMPAVPIICQRIGMSEHTYYLKLGELVTNGYLSVERMSPEHGKFQRNRYTLHLFPDKFKTNRADGQYRAEYKDIRDERSILAPGYTLLPKLPMIAPGISYTEKGVLAYLFLFATRKEPIVWPACATMARHLNISQKTVSRSLKALVETPFVTRHSQMRTEGRFGASCYELLFSAEPSTQICGVAPSTQICGVVPSAQNCGMEPSTQICGMVPSTQISDGQIYSGQKTGSQNCGTNIIPVSSNTSTSNTQTDSNTIHLSFNGSPRESISEPPDGMSDGEIETAFLSEESVTPEYIAVNILAERNIPKAWLEDEVMRTAAIHFLCDWEHRSKPSYYQDSRGHWLANNSELQRKVYITFVSAIDTMLMPSAKLVVQDTPVSPLSVWNKLTLFIDDTVSDCPSLEPLLDACTFAYLRAVSERTVKAPIAYMRSIIWNVLCDGGIAEESEYWSY